MTESEWFAATDPDPMVEAISFRTTDRKLRLLALACLPVLKPHLRIDWWDEAVAVLTAVADGRARADALEPVHQRALAIQQEIATDPSEQRWYDAEMFAADGLTTSLADVISQYITTAVARCAHAVCVIADGQDHERVRSAEWGRQRHLLHCIFGNPFRPVTFDPRWRSETAVALAAGIYEARAFDRLPILADALEEAGCDHPDVLTHCREPDTPHARGCWVIDGVLGKT